MVELLVSMTIFTIIIGVCVTIFITALKNQRILVNLMAVNDNVSQITEQIAREARVGTSFTTNGVDLNFTNIRTESITYRLNTTTGALERGVNGSFSPITADNVKVTVFSVVLSGQQAGDTFAPRITLTMTASGRLKELLETYLTLQTTVSARNIDT